MLPTDQPSIFQLLTLTLKGLLNISRKKRVTTMDTEDNNLLEKYKEKYLLLFQTI